MLGKLILITGLVCLTTAALEPISGQKKQLRLFHKGIVPNVIQVQSSLSFTDCVPNSRKANSQNRQTYFQCTTNGLALMKCPEKRIFEAASGACIKNNTPPKREITPTCTVNGAIFPSRENCEAYWLCSNGKAEYFVCPSDLYWDKTLSTCNYQRFVTCGVSGWSAPVNSNTLKRSKTEEKTKSRRKWVEK